MKEGGRTAWTEPALVNKGLKDEEILGHLLAKNSYQNMENVLLVFKQKNSKCLVVQFLKCF